MSLFYEKLWLFNTVVHENGKYTLLEVILYFRHFLWEVPIKVVYSLFIVGIFFYYGKPLVRIDNRHVLKIPARQVFLSGVLAFAVVLLSVFMTARDIGLRDTLMGLFQYRTHELRPLEFGSHWRNHFLSNIVLFSTSAFFILLYRMVNNNGQWVKRKASSLFPISVVVFVFLTLFFGMTMDPFQTPSYLGHQLREVFGSDLSITMFLCLAVLICLEGKYDTEKTDSGIKKQRNFKGNLLLLVCWSIPIVFIIGFLVVKVLSLDIRANIESIGYTKDWSVLDLFAWHFFEHSLDYTFIVFFIYFIYLLALRMDLNRPIN
ncbi:MAG: hypothetical protein SWO11_03915 [Thermodesulfobacteriota bacterium]|nr:hypothetical protein [Thermodesulfobacteriota bacterium]